MGTAGPLSAQLSPAPAQSLLLDPLIALSYFHGDAKTSDHQRAAGFWGGEGGGGRMCVCEDPHWLHMHSGREGNL